MTIVLFILAVLVFGLLIAIASVIPNPASLSPFELEHRHKKGDKSIYLDTLREQMLVDVSSVQRALAALLLAVFVLLSVATFGVFFGVLIGVFVAVEYGAIAQLRFVYPHAQRLYDKHELRILEFISRHQSVIKWLRSVVPQDREVRITSKDELEDLVTHSHNVLSEDEKNSNTE